MWRVLEDNDIIQEGDQYYDTSTRGWVDVDVLVGQTISDISIKHCIRREVEDQEDWKQKYSTLDLEKTIMEWKYLRQHNDLLKEHIDLLKRFK